MRTFTNNKGETLDSTLTDEQAVACCRRLTNTFAKELVSRWDTIQRHHRNGQDARPLSAAQLYWLHKLALEGDAPKPTAQNIGDLTPIVNLFQTVRAHVQFPKIRLSLPVDPTQPNGPRQSFALTWASTGAKYPNTVNVTNGAPFGSSVWYGRIMPTGEFFRARDCPDAVISLLKRFAADPVGVATEHGKLNNKCCFCNTALTDARSVNVGYGPVCADHYGLPWGDERSGQPLSAIIAPNKPLFDNTVVQAEYERLLAAGLPPAVAEERAFDPLIAAADRADRARADAHSLAQDYYPVVR